jgi:two-component system response regulator YesN
VEEGCSEAEILFDSSCFTVIILSLDTKHKEIKYAQKDWDLILFAFENILTEIWEDQWGYYWVDPESGNCVLLAVNGDIQSAGGQLSECVNKVKHEIDRLRGILRTTVTVTTGPEVGSWSLISYSYREALGQINCSRKVPYHPMNSTPAVGPSSEQSQIQTDDAAIQQECGSQIITQAMKFIQKHYNRTLTLKEVALQVHVNSSYLSYLFKEVTGENFIHFLTKCRITKAKEILGNSQYKVYEVGEMVGFENAQYFTEIFKRYAGMTPNDYRNTLS